MNIAQLVDRSNALYTKYEMYIPKSGEDKENLKRKGAFEDCYVDLIDQINNLTLKAQETGNENNRAIRAAQNAELRKAKSNLTDVELPKLEKLIRRGKKLSRETIDDRLQKVQQVKEGIASIPDGVSGSRKPQKPLVALDAKGKGKREIQLEGGVDGRQTEADYHKQTEASKAFQREWEVAKVKQDKALENIEKGLGVLKGLGEAMGENLNQQDILISEMDAKMDSANKSLKTNNMKLKGLVHQMRSGRNFCMDAALICILLAMGLWIWQLYK